MAKRFQHKIATGRYTLPATVVYVVVMLIATGIVGAEHWMQIALFSISTFLMVILNNSNSLIRVFSRLVSCSFMVLSLTVPMLWDSLAGSISQVMFIASLLLLFNAYQDRRSMGTIFFAFAFLGGMSTQFIQVLFFVPLLWMLMFTSLQSGSLRVFSASCLGLLLPYWFWLCWCFHNGCYFCIVDHVSTIADFSPVAHGLFTTRLFIPLAFISALGIAGIVNFLATSYADNIKTRMLYNVFITLFIAALLLVILQPQHSDFLLRIMIVCASPLLAHFYNFTNSWVTNLSLYAVILASIVITVLNTWMF